MGRSSRRLVWVPGALASQPSAQANPTDSLAVARLIGSFNSRRGRQPESSLAVLREIVARQTASKRDTQTVANLAVTEANQLVKRFRTDSATAARSTEIAYASLADSLGAGPGSLFLLSVGHLRRAEKEGAVAERWLVNR